MGRKRKRYKDRHQVATNSRKPAGDWKTRHSTRKSRANAHERHAAFAFIFLGGWLRISNNGHHWTILFQDGELYQWWPSSAKLVVGNTYQDGYHAHTWKDVFKFIYDQRQMEV